MKVTLIQIEITLPEGIESIRIPLGNVRNGVQLQKDAIVQQKGEVVEEQVDACAVPLKEKIEGKETKEVLSE